MKFRSPSERKLGHSMSVDEIDTVLYDIFVTSMVIAKVLYYLRPNFHFSILLHAH